MEAIQTRGQKALGPELVVKAWTDPAFKARLLQNANAAGAELGIAVGGLLHLLPVESLSSSGRKCLAWPRCGDAHAQLSGCASILPLWSVPRQAALSESGWPTVPAHQAASRAASSLV